MSGALRHDVLRSAEISICGDYRYALWRRWDGALPTVLFVGLNPSTADGEQDDPTIRRCMGFAHRWGFGGVAMANLFAFRCTNPKGLGHCEDPIGPDNDRWIRMLAEQANTHIAAWGAAGIAQARGSDVLSWLSGVSALGLTASGQPRHPLYVRSDQPLISYLPAASV